MIIDSEAACVRDQPFDSVTEAINQTEAMAALGRYEQADLLLELALSQFSQDFDLLHLWAELPARASHRAETLSRWRQLSERFPNWMDCDLAIAIHLRMVERFRASEDVLRHVIDKDGFAPLNVRLGLCDVLQHIGDAEAAAAEAFALWAANSQSDLSIRFFSILRQLLDDTLSFQTFSKLFDIGLRQRAEQQTEVELFILDVAARSRPRLGWVISAMRQVEADDVDELEPTFSRCLDLIGGAEALNSNATDAIDRAIGCLRTKAIVGHSEPPLSSPADLDVKVFRLDCAIAGEWSHEEELRHEFHRMVRHLNHLVGDKRLRLFQYVICKEAVFPLAAPLGSDWHYVGCLYLAGLKSIAYGFSGDLGAVWLITTGAGSAYRIEGVYLRRESLVYVLYPEQPGLPGFLRNQIDAIDQLPPESFRPNDAPPADVVIVSGQANYAHYMWNEVTALLEITSWPTSAVSGALVVHEPFGPFGTLANWPLALHQEVTTEAAVAGLPPRLHHKMLVTPGSMIVSDATRKQIRRAATEAGGAIDLPAPQPNRRLLWFSLRLMYRSAVNEADLAVELARHLAIHLPDYDVALDGFSLPWDIDIPGRCNRDYLRDHAERTAAFAAEVAAAMTSATAGAVCVYDWSQATLPQALLLGRYADFYVCHHGTQQHKIGWMYDVPGIIHGNHLVSSYNPNGEWTLAQAGFAHQPSYVPARFIEEVQAEGDRQDQPYFRNYRFSDVSGLTDYIIAHMLKLHREKYELRVHS